MRKWFVVAVVVMVALSGCASEEAPETVDDAGTDEAGGADAGNQTQEDDDPVDASGNTTDDGGEEQPAVDGSDPAQNSSNQAPDVTLTPSVTEGEAPLPVNFTVTATDADGDTVAWTLTGPDDLGAEGEGNGTVAFTLEDEGTYNFVLNATDGNHTVSRNVTIVVAPPTPEAPGPPCETVTPGGASVQGTNVAAGTSGVYIVAGTAWAPGLYQESNGIAGLQTEESCPSNPDSRTGP